MEIWLYLTARLGVAGCDFVVRVCEGRAATGTDDVKLCGQRRERDERRVRKPPAAIMLNHHRISSTSPFISELTVIFRKGMTSFLGMRRKLS